MIKITYDADTSTWNGEGVPDDYPVTSWNDDMQLMLDVMELVGEGHDVTIARS